VENEDEDLDKLLRADEVAALLGVPIGTIYAWQYRRVGPIAIRVGRHLRFRRSDVRKWLREQELRRGS
jgi:excisionase family DNA binding protein